MKHMHWFSACRRHRETLSLAANGVLSRGEATAFWTHLESCAACRRRFTELAQLTRVGHALAAETAEALPSPYLASRWEARLQAAMAEDRGATGRLPLRPAWTGLALLWVFIAFLRFSAPAIQRGKPTESPADWRSALIALGVPVRAGVTTTESAPRPAEPSRIPAKPLGEHEPRLGAPGLAPA